MIEEICERYGIKNYTINDDGSIDVDNHVDLMNLNLTELPLKFNKIWGDFYCAKNKLTTLKGSPVEVGESFNCNYNKLTSLEHSPIKVGGDFLCSNNQITSLKGCPKFIRDEFLCQYNNIIKLEEIPDDMMGDVYFGNNPIGSISHLMDINFLRAFISYKVMKDDTINLKRLRYLMEQFDKSINLDKIEKYYKII